MYFTLSLSLSLSLSLAWAAYYQQWQAYAQQQGAAGPGGPQAGGAGVVGGGGQQQQQQGITCTVHDMLALVLIRERRSNCHGDLPTPLHVEISPTHCDTPT